MISSHPSSSIYDQYQSQGIPDPVDEFLSQLLLDVPDSLLPHIPPYVSAPTSSPAPAPTPAPTLVPAPALASAPLPAPLPNLTCHWVSQHDQPHICGAPLSSDPKHVCMHFRLAHDVRGNDKVTVGCLWYACHAAPMQRGSVIRHILAVHLGLLRWRCEGCGRVFSRKGTGHVCGGGVHA